MRRSIILILLIINIAALRAQIGGESTFEFLSLPNSARLTAAGGVMAPVWDGDLSLAYHNPSLLNPAMHNHLTFSTVAYMGGINYGNLQYARYWNKIGLTYAGGINYITYGNITRADVTGTPSGSFGAGEMVIHGSGAYPYGKYNFGGNIKLIYSQLESYKAFGLAFDASVAYADTARGFTATLLFKNIGGQLKPYTDGTRQSLPFDIQIGLSKKLKKAPFRLMVTLHNLYRWNIAYDDPNFEQSGNIFSDDTTSNSGPSFADNLFGHIVFGTEVTIAKIIRLSIAYNHLRRHELKLVNKGGLSGISLGFGARIKAFSIDYGFGSYHAAGGAHQFTVTADLNRFIKKKKL